MDAATLKQANDMANVYVCSHCHSRLDISDKVLLGMHCYEVKCLACGNGSSFKRASLVPQPSPAQLAPAAQSR